MKHTLQLGIVILVLTFAVGCETQADKDRRANAALEFQTQLQEQANASADALHDAQLEGVRLTQGDTAESQLRICFDDGGYDYPRRANLDGSVRPIQLSNRRIATCDQILKALARHNAQQEADEKRKDDAYDKAHPSVSK
jgi:hypothetical protein